MLGFWLVPLVAKRRDLVAAMVGELLGAVAAGELEVVIGGVYPLGEAARAHEEIAGAPQHRQAAARPRRLSFDRRSLTYLPA